MNLIHHFRLFSDKTSRKICWLLSLAFFILMPLHLGLRAFAFSWSPDNIQHIAIYTYGEDNDLNLHPDSINWNVATGAIPTFLGTIDWDNAYDCSDWGAVTTAVVYIHFGDGTTTPYEYSPPYISRKGIYGTCREVSDEGDEFIQNNGQ